MPNGAGAADRSERAQLRNGTAAWRAGTGASRTRILFAGIKSYGRAPTFLMMTGYEQVRSIAADIAGDKEAAARVELELPETGVCTRSAVDTGATASSCCGGPAPLDVAACCADDAVAKA